MNDKLRAVLVGLVGAGWFLNLCAPILVDSYHTNLAANAPLLLILGSLFQAGRTKK